MLPRLKIKWPFKVSRLASAVTKRGIKTAEAFIEMSVSMEDHRALFSLSSLNPLTPEERDGFFPLLVSLNL